MLNHEPRWNAPSKHSQHKRIMSVKKQPAQSNSHTLHTPSRPARHPGHPYAVATLTLLQVGTLIAVSEVLNRHPRAFLAWALCSLLYALLAPRIARLCCDDTGALRIPAPLLFLFAAAALIQGLLVFGLYAKFTLVALLPRTPYWAMALSAAFAVTMVLQKGEAALKRLCRKLLPYAIVILPVVCILQVESHRVLETLLAMTDHSKAPFGTADLQALLAVLLISFCRPALLTPILFPEMDAAAFGTAQRRAALIFGPLVTLQLLMPVLTLGLPFFLNTPLSYYDAINLLVHGSPVVRMDTLIGLVLVQTALIDLGAAALVVRRAVQELRQR